MLADRQADAQTDKLITIPRCRTGAELKCVDEMVKRGELSLLSETVTQQVSE